MEARSTSWFSALGSIVVALVILVIFGAFLASFLVAPLLVVAVAGIGLVVLGAVSRGSR